MYKPSTEELELLKRWYAPDVTEKVAEDRTNALGMNVAELSQKKAVVEEEVVTEDVQAPSALSAQELEEITQQAQQQGFEQGLEKGIAQGIVQGHEEGYKQGVEQGVEEGREQGLATIQPELEHKLALIDSLLERLQTPLAKQEQEIEQSLLHLAMVLAKKVIHTEVKQHHEPIVQAVSEALVLLKDSSPLTLRLNPQDTEYLKQVWTEDEISQRHITLQLDPSLSDGDCVIESPSSSVSSVLTERIEHVFEDFKSQERPNTQYTDSQVYSNEEQTLADSSHHDQTIEQAQAPEGSPREGGNEHG
ncbi:FliH/SctL family protein [Psychrobium sp. 1_MG-2023]|uniref:FliH/SctL family protein n=1 Tax=Psychrobium sp. 1_MG-2023 TaxID=3062624 RepID=UPI0027339EB5|nr:FliH/SctL family protein [Psychrobium sp. 1_MG-2023]MDP2559836.1 FliH/SctL family protein [Psychrobium sp. 1_MG-2023]